MAFHNMQLLAYQEKQHSFITVVANTSDDRGQYRKRTDFDYLRTFSNRTIGAEDVFPGIRDQIRQDPDLYDSSEGELSLVFLFPYKTANYFAWKSTTVCKKFGYDPAQVRICRAQFQKNRNGFWSLIINSLIFKDGRTVEVEDFEKNW